MIDKTEPKCLMPGCPQKVICRGLCHDHYQQATKAVKLKKTTWEELIAVKLATPSTYGRRPKHGRIMDALKLAREGLEK